jgi:hypothetical protein
LKERSDKRDAIALAASLTGFQVGFYDSVNGDDMSDKARPPVCIAFNLTIPLQVAYSSS